MLVEDFDYILESLPKKLNYELFITFLDPYIYLMNDTQKKIWYEWKRNIKMKRFITFAELRKDLTNDNNLPSCWNYNVELRNTKNFYKQFSVYSIVENI